MPAGGSFPGQPARRGKTFNLKKAVERFNIPFALSEISPVRGQGVTKKQALF